MNASSLQTNRRHFLKLAAGKTSVIWLGAPSALWSKDVPKSALTSVTADLAGRWKVSQAGAEEWLPASVPGCVHTDLLAAGKISDPFHRDNLRTEVVVKYLGR